MSSSAERREVYNTPRWRKLRARIVESSGWPCQWCEAEGLTVAGVEVHHIKAIRDGGAPFAADNLVLLCRKCHELTRQRKEPDPAAVVAWREFTNQLCEL